MKKSVFLVCLLAFMLCPAFAQTELIVNGGFELNNTIAPWVSSGSPVTLSTLNAYAGNQCLLLANGIDLVQDVYQTITFPTNLIAANFSFYYNIVTSDPNLDTTIGVNLTDINDNSLDNIGSASNLTPTGGYVQSTTSLVTYNGLPNLTYAGKTVEVHFQVATSPSGGATQFYLDDVSMQIATTADIPVNDDFSNLTVFAGSPVTIFANNTYASKESGEPDHAGNVGGHSLWWAWVAPSNGIVTINNFGSSFQTLMAVYTGGALTNLTPVAASNNGTTTAISFKATAGTEYDIAVDGYNGATGSIIISFAFTPDVTPPKVTITAPAAGASVTDSSFLLTGKASDNVAVAQVQYRLENVAGTNDYQVATGTTNWSAIVPNLIPGNNTVRVRAIDTSSNISATVTRTVDYTVVQPLTLTINGSGTVSGATNRQLLTIGDAYKVIAKPNTGFGFAGWTGNVITNALAASFIMETNLALQANFVDITKPVLTITNPVKSGLLWSNAMFTLSGKCSDNVAVSNVLVSLNGGGWTPAALSNNDSNWTQQVTLVAGTNAFAACAVDTSGNRSLTNSTKLIYALTAPLTVSTNGRGTLTPNDNGLRLRIGASYAMAAKAATGFGFVNWTDDLGNIITNGLTLKFIMESNLTFVANFVDITKPVLTITNPVKSGLLWSNAMFTLSGKCSDNVAVSNVLVSLNGGGWTPAALSNNDSNWTQQVTLVAGTNAFAACAVDTSGNRSLTNSTKLIYALTAPLTVSTNGRGTLTPNDNGLRLRIGASYAMAAKAATGFGFVNWTDDLGNIITNGLTLKFIMESNLTFVANFVDITKPVLTITNPAKSGLLWSNAMFTLSGKCSDNVAVSNVLVSLNGGGWTPAALSNNDSNWTQQVTLVAGTNTFAACAVDTSGNRSLTNSTKLIYALTAPLTVSTNGRGTLTPNDNGLRLRIGASYAMAAKAATGFGFVNWTDDLGNIITNGLTLKFIMESNLTFVANFVDITKPVLTITNPAKSGLLWSNVMFTLSGKCSDNVAVSNVLVSLNGGGWTPAALSNNDSNWTQQVTLVAGTNTFAACAVDTSGNRSLTNSTKLIYIVDTRTIIGSWNLIRFQTPAQIYFDENNVLQGGSNFDIGNGSLTLDTNGFITGSLGDVFTGTYTDESNGIINAVITNASGIMPLTFYVNAGKNNMTELDTLFDTNDNQQEIVIGHRIPPVVAAADLAGTWNVIQFQTPVQITGDMNTGIQGGYNFGVTNGTINLNANGTFSGKLVQSVTGTFSVGSNGVVNLVPSTSGAQPLTFYLNFAKDTMAAVSSQLDASNNQQQLNICYRVPTSVVLTDLAGSWNLVEFQTPLQYLPGNTSFPDGGSNFGVTNGTMIVSANGTISGTLGQSFTGSVNPETQGVIHASINSGGTGSQTFTFFINASKDTMMEVEQQLDADNNQQQIVIAHRGPAN